ncbi:MAG: hypothetical protein GY847_27920 [Proteobacteria bacterium]|nr:hypothetical protein [Pseudomonadota bacterium]
MSYKGPERRIHNVFVTHNREYHVRSGLCIAVRDRKTGVWISNHEAVDMMLEENLRANPLRGFPLLFLSRFCRIRTSKVIDIIRPERGTIGLYGLVSAVCPT